MKNVEKKQQPGISRFFTTSDNYVSICFSFNVIYICLFYCAIPLEKDHYSFQIVTNNPNFQL